MGTEGRRERNGKRRDKCNFGLPVLLQDPKINSYQGINIKYPTSPNPHKKQAIDIQIYKLKSRQTYNRHAHTPLKLATYHRGNSAFLEGEPAFTHKRKKGKKKEKEKKKQVPVIGTAQGELKTESDLETFFLLYRRKYSSRSSSSLMRTRDTHK